MKNLKIFNLIFTFALLTFSFSVVSAQDESPADSPKPQFDRPHRPNLLQELGLSQEQMQEIKRLNADKKPIIREAQARLRQANRNLDEAIYADNIAETEIQARVKEVQIAQAEVIKIRSLTELAVRKILTPEQLTKFREMRRRFAERMENRQYQRGNPTNEIPGRRRNNRQNSLRPNY